MLTQQDLFNLTRKQAEEEDKPVEPKVPIGRKIVDKAKEIGSGVVMAGGALGAGVASLAQPIPPSKINPNLD